MADFLSMDDLVIGMNGAADLTLIKSGAAMEGLGAWFHSKWYEAGTPGAGAAPSSGLNGGALSSTSAQVTGQIHHVNAAAGNVKRLLGFFATADRAGALYAFDRLWANSGIAITTTTAQAITSAALPSRDANGAALGEGVMAAIEVSSATGNGGAITNTTLNYTNESGTAGRTATIPSFPATAVAGTFVPFMLQAGDRGVRSIQGITLGTSYVSGTIHIVLYRRIGRPLPFSKDGGETVCASWDELGKPRLFDGAVPMLAWAPRDTTAVNITGGGWLAGER